MKFKVGDKVRAIDNKYTFTSKDNGFVGEVIELIDEITSIEHKNLAVKDLNASAIYKVNSKHFELVEPQTEFTFQEVIARIKPGEVYEAIDRKYATQTINMREDREININILPNQHYMVPTYSLFKLQEPKKKVTIYKVEVTKGGIKWSLTSSQKLEIGMFVVTDKYKEYGKVVDIEYLDLTDKEIENYEECWRA